MGFRMPNSLARRPRIQRALAALGLMVALLGTGCRCCDGASGRSDAPRPPREPSLVILGPRQQRLTSATLRTAWSSRHFGKRIDAPSEIVTDAEGAVGLSVIQRLADTDAWLIPAASDTGPRFAPARLREALALSTQHLQLAAEGEFSGLIRRGPRGDRRVTFRLYGSLVGADGRRHIDKRVVVVGSDDRFRGPTVADRRFPVGAYLEQVFDEPGSAPLSLGRLSGPISPGCEVVIHLRGPVVRRATISARRPDGSPLLLDLTSVFCESRPVYSIDGAECSDAVFFPVEPVAGSSLEVSDLNSVGNVTLHQEYVLSGYVSSDMKKVGMPAHEFRETAERFSMRIKFEGPELELVIPAPPR